MSSTDQLSGGNVEPRFLEEEMRSSYLDYAMSVIVGRALPDVRDGLKPVHRRVLFSMNENGLAPNRPYRKCAGVVGDVMGRYHPHGDQSIYDTLVRLAQPFAMREPLVDGQGNFGSIDADPAAAMRYTESRLARLATEMLRDIDSDTVDFVPNYDDTRRSRSSCRRASRTCSSTARRASRSAWRRTSRRTTCARRSTPSSPTSTTRQIETADLMKHLKGPDFPTGGIIVGRSGIKDAYETGRGRIVVRGPRAHRAAAPGQGGDHRHRDALPGHEG